MIFVKEKQTPEATQNKKPALIVDKGSSSGFEAEPLDAFLAEISGIVGKKKKDAKRLEDELAIVGLQMGTFLLI